MTQESPRILILTAFHGRPHISALYWLGIARLRENFNIKTMAVVSDPDNLKLAREHSDFVVETENDPHGLKMNIGLSEAVKQEFEILMQLGSDNLITNAGMMKNIDMFTRGTLFFGLNRILFYNVETGQAKQKFYGNVFGAGRCITRPILIKALRKKPLWDNDRSRGLDMNFERSVEETTGYVPVPVEFTEPQVIDVKSAENIWPYDYFNEPSCDPEIIKGMVSKQEYKALMELTRPVKASETKPKRPKTKPDGQA